MVQWCDDSHLLGASSHAGSDTNSNELGIVFGHAYSILSVKQVDDLQMMKMRNPWGQGEWKGDFCDDSPKWTQRLTEKLKQTSAEDGVFWMQFHDFLENFRSLHVCRIFNKDIYKQKV